MLRRFVCFKPQVLHQLRQQSTTTRNKNKWDLLVGIQLERLPILSRTFNKLERDYQVSFQ